MRYVLNVNGRDHRIDAEPDMPLLWALRDLIGLTGSKFGCGAGLCGACSVHIDGSLEVSCQMAVSDAVGKRVTTIEGLPAHPLGERLLGAWAETDVVQCGYCQPGQLMAAAALLSTNHAPDDAAIDEAMQRNLCRCGTYPRIRQAIHNAAKHMASAR